MTTAVLSPIHEAFRTELTRVLAGEFNANTLKTLIRMAKAAQQFLMADGLLAQGGDIINDEDAEPGQSSALNMSSGLLYSPSAMGGETYGAKMMREIFAALPGILNKQHETPAALVSAVVVARNAGLIDVADELQFKLTGTRPERKLPSEWDAAQQKKPVSREAQIEAQQIQEEIESGDRDNNGVLYSRGPDGLDDPPEVR